MQVLWVAIALSIVLFFVEFYRNHNPLQSLIIALTFSMSAIPEEFPLVFTLYLSLGAWRLSKKGVLVKSLPSVETLGRVDVICTDKTGTLTEGKFQLEDFISFTQSSLSSQKIWETALLACEPHIVDAMEIAILNKAQSLEGEKLIEDLKNWKLLIDNQFDPQDKYMSHVWQNSQLNISKLAMKGSIEGVLKHCELKPNELDFILQEVRKLASQGKRLLGLAQKVGTFSDNRQANESGLEFLGILVFADPLRPSTQESILKCQKSGIEIKLITGDHPLTAHAIADEVGILHDHEKLFSGDQLLQMSPQEKHQAYQKGALFSRMQPEQKHELVQSLKSEGKIIAMTGDGINDAPALKLADIGISLGKNATDVAQAAAKMVLISNDFKGLTEAILEGRKIFKNLQKSFSYLISFHLPILLLALLPPILGWGELLLPVHIVLLELIVHPISAFVFENLPNDSKNPIKSAQELLSTKSFIKSLLRGFIFSLGALVFFYFLLKNQPLEQARTQIFTAFLFANIIFMLLDMNFFINLRLITTTTIILGFCFILTLEPNWLTQVLHFENIPIKDLLISFLIGSSPLLIEIFDPQIKKPQS
jgi:Ca2+-transporting ATPase